MGLNRAIADLPQRLNKDGQIRKVGVELEFGGLSPAHAAKIVGHVLGAEAEQVDAFRQTIPTKHGRFTVELDTRWAHPEFVAAYASDLPEEIREDVAKGVSQAAGTVLASVFPVELVCPPIPYDQLTILRPSGAALADAGALGTAHSAFSGFGMHLNVEVADLQVEHLLDTMRAYLLLDFWLRRESRIALVRQLQHYIQPFSESYKRHVLAPEYAPDLATFMDDHMRLNPTRNMELDLLPIFAVIDRARVESALPGIKNSPRPTFHWRLPNCRIDEPEWEPGQDWDRWVTVETLATDKVQLDHLARAYLRDGPATEFQAQMRRFFDILS